jgi:hypothetical protein
MSQEQPDEFSPEKMAELIFSDLPADPVSIGLLPFNESDDIDLETDAIAFNFEILLNMYMEGIIDVERLAQMLVTKEVVEMDPERYNKKIKIDEVTTDILELIKPWFVSFGYTIIVSELEIEPNTDPIKEYGIENYYCKILLRDNPEDYGVFYFKQLKTPYHFTLNAKFDSTQIKSMKDMMAMFIKPKKRRDPTSKEKLFTISFSPIKVNHNGTFG